MWLRRSLPLAAPTRWQRAVEKVSFGKILPGNPEQKFAAFVGDKILGFTAAAWMRKSKGPFDHSDATRLVSTILSNKFFAERIDTILPDKTYNEAAKSMSEHSIGTMVEAAVAATNDTDAVNDLVDWLMEEARNLDIINTKGRLLELGGTVTCNRIGGRDHLPVFRATASLEDQIEEADGSSKKDAEQTAARKCLQTLGYLTGVIVDSNEIVNVDLPMNQWNKFAFREAVTVELENGETTLDWWKRGARDRKSSFSRALMAPFVFPSTIIGVDSWTRRSDDDGDAAVLLTVLYSKDGVKSCWSHTVIAESGRSARSKAGVATNNLIAEVVAVRLPDGPDV